MRLESRFRYDGVVVHASLPLYLLDCDDCAGFLALRGVELRDVQDTYLGVVLETDSLHPV